MRIGILTYQYAINYGAVLQAYALKTYLEKSGHDVEILNYDTSYLYLKNRSMKSKLISSSWNVIKNILGGQIKKKKFDEFREECLKLNSPVMQSQEELKVYIQKKQFDAFIVGSDQVWNPEINGRDNAYYLNFVKDGLKIAYAASFGVSSLDRKDLEVIVKNLKTFSAISVREKTGKQLLNLLQREIQVVLDPVFLLDVNLWNEFAGKRIVSDKYILCYVLPGNHEIEIKIEKMAKEYSEKTGYEVLFVGRKEYKQFINDGKDMVFASPKEFVNLVRNAEVIITNSFHGTAFSIIFSKQFYSLVNSKIISNKQLGSRIVDLLTEIGLEENLVEPSDYVVFNKNIDYKPVMLKLEQLKVVSCEFLNSGLSKNKGKENEIS